jgi:hypothetical protein
VAGVVKLGNFREIIRWPDEAGRATDINFLSGGFFL